MLIPSLFLQDTTEKFAPSEVKAPLIAKYPQNVMHIPDARVQHLFVIHDESILTWLSEYYLFPNQITIVNGVGEYEGTQFIKIPYAA